MKKLIMACVICLVFVMTPVLTSAANLSIPKAAKKPVIDGKINAAEWKKAFKTSLSIKNLPKTAGDSNGLTAATAPADLAKVKNAYFMYDKNGLYAAFKVSDTNVNVKKDAGATNLNENDCIQLVFDPLNKKSPSLDDAYIFSLAPFSGSDDKGPAIWFEHWRLASADPKLGVKVKAKKVKGGYDLECFIPWKALTAKGEKFTVKSKYKMGFTFLVVDYKDGACVDILCSTGKGTWGLGDAGTYDTLVFK